MLDHRKIFRGGLRGRDLELSSAETAPWRVRFVILGKMQGVLVPALVLMSECYTGIG